MADNPIRLAAVSYLNTRPLVAAIASGEVPGYEVVEDVPSRLPERVESGAADLGLIPAGYCARHPDLLIAPGAGIACRGAVRSILLFCRTTAREASRIATTNSSISSVALLRLLCEHWYGIRPEFRTSSDPLREMADGRADAALLIGDPALQAEGVEFRSYDLGEEWFRMTGQPFVFAFWAGKVPEVVARAAPDLVRAMAMGRNRIPQLAAAAAPGLGLPVEVCEEYLSHYIIHDIGDAEMAGYEEFRRLLDALERPPA